MPIEFQPEDFNINDLSPEERALHEELTQQTDATSKWFHSQGISVLNVMAINLNLLGSALSIATRHRDTDLLMQLSMACDALAQKAADCVADIDPGLVSMLDSQVQDPTKPH